MQLRLLTALIMVDTAIDRLIFNAADTLKRRVLQRLRLGSDMVDSQSVCLSSLVLQVSVTP